MTHQIKPAVDLWLIHCAGKVGSVSICQGLAKAGVNTDQSSLFKTHVLNQKNLDRAISNSGTEGHISASISFLERFRSEDYHHCCVLIGRRDPVAQAVSAFFQNIVQFTGEKFVSESDTDAVLASLHSKVRELINFNSRTWWDTEVLDFFGFDPLSFQFDKDEGVSLTTISPKLSIVLYTVERGMNNLPGILEKLSGTSPVSIPTVNTANDEKHYKPYDNRAEIGRLYNSVCKSFKLPVETLNEAYACRSSTFFYDNNQIADFTSRWRETG